MGYLNNQSIVVDAIITKRGRELLARGRNEFNITQFALSDDEIDYDLWNPNHPNGTAYYGSTIEAMPLTEAVPDETQVMKYKLVTLQGKRITKIPTIKSGLNADTFIVRKPSDILEFTPSNDNSEVDNLNAYYGYSAILSSDDLGTLIATTRTPAQDAGVDVAQSSYPLGSISEGETTVVVSGMAFRFIPSMSPERAKKGTITVVANETGARATIYLDIRRRDLQTESSINDA